MAVDPKSELSGSEADEKAALYARVVPSGMSEDQKTLKAVILLTPDTESKSKAGSNLCLNRWTHSVFSALKNGTLLKPEVDPSDPAAPAWTMTLRVLPVQCPCKEDGTPLKPTAANLGTAVPVSAKARLSETAFERNGDAFEKTSLAWETSFPSKKIDKFWHDLGKTLAASLGANSADKGNLAEVKEEEKYLKKFNKDRPETEIGDHGQIEQNLKPGEPKIIDSILAVPQSDMAFSLETQRVEELLCSIRSTCGLPNLRYEAEFDRFKRIYGELAKNCKEEEGQDCRNIAKIQGETEEAFENRKQSSITENLKTRGPGQNTKSRLRAEKTARKF